MKTLKCTDGFTIVELMIVLFIIGALVAFLIPYFTGKGQDVSAPGGPVDLGYNTPGKTYYLAEIPRPLVIDNTGEFYPV